MPHGHMILLPVLAQVLLTICVYIGLGVVKARAVNAGLVDLERRALHDDAWPPNVMQFNNNIRNQFEVPVLFFVVTFVLWSVGAAGSLAQTLAWLFVASRVVHALVHTGSNHVPTRRAVFMFGCLVVLAMTLLAVWSVLQSL